MLQPPRKKVRVVERFAEDADAVVAAVCSEGWAERARVIKDTDKASVLLGNAEGAVGGEVVVKTVRARLFGGTKLGRDAKAWRRLRAAGVAVPRYVAHVRGGGVESLIMERVAGRSLLWEIARGARTVREDHELARAVGEFTARIVQPGGEFNRDHKASNIMVRHADDGFDLTLIDLDGFGVSDAGISDDMDCLERMVAKLAIECIGCGVLPRRAVLMRVIDSALRAYEYEMDMDHDRAHRKRLWRWVRGIVEQHGDPTPKDDPLEFDRRMMGID